MNLNEPQTEQRIRNPRARISELIYMNLQSGNGGILVDVSRTGLGFQAAEPIDTTAPVNFRIAAGAIGAIELTGELIWTDRARKRGGLRFGHLPIEVRQQIQNWLEPLKTFAVGDYDSRDQFGHEDFSRDGAAIPRVPRVANDAHEAMHLHNADATRTHVSEVQAGDADAGDAQVRVAHARIAQSNDAQLDWNISDTETASAPLSDALASDLAPSRLASNEVADRTDTNSAPATIDSSRVGVDEVDAADAAHHRLQHGSTKFSDAKLGDPKIVDANFSVPRHSGPAPVGAKAGTKIGSANGDTGSGTAKFGSRNFGAKPSDMTPDTKLADANLNAVAKLGDTKLGDVKPSTTATSGAKPTGTSAANANDDVLPRSSQQSAQQSYVGPLGIPLRTPVSSTPLSEQAAGYRATLNPRSIFVSDQEFKARLRAFESSQRRRRGRITAIVGIVVVALLAGGAYLYQRQTGSSIVQLAGRITGRGNAEANNSKYADDNGALSSFSSNDSDQSPVQSLAPSLAMSPSLAAPQPQAPNPAIERSGNNSAENTSGNVSVGNTAASNSAIGGAANSAVNHDSATRNPASTPASAANSTSTFATAANEPPASGTHPAVPSVMPSVTPSVAPSQSAVRGSTNAASAAANARANSGLNARYPATKSASESPAEPGTANSRSLDSGSADLALANRYLQSGSSNDRAVGAQLLWTAVGEGNMQAELELADLYLRGDAGLSKNCEQARVLLMAASESYSPAAQEKLADLSAYGCK